ncbi:hypothetical protein GWO43_24250, partial [candidate division KSB1 bacterium]|nr:hypothetical protein [candidate division KSB1 bacterium]NIS27084.1 hypothetical protein [candidate division KSB1 bacterium]NIT73928.1 hypothetical protein [candidate division KSB1 bacterium]NIU27829.1 hypothetical protein [candidate division KSB1 bacterium]NIU93598.1 hypothetical protein [candidate division KSB1 bacterium]
MDRILAEFDWSLYQHAYGIAVDIPDAIASLNSSDLDVREDAMYRLLSSICHQGTLYSATAPAVQAAISIASTGKHPNNYSVFELLGTIAGAASLKPSQFTGYPIDGNPYSLATKKSTESEYNHVLHVQKAFASKRPELESLSQTANETSSPMIKKILNRTESFPFSDKMIDFCDPVYQRLKIEQLNSIYSFASSKPTASFKNLAKALGTEISAIQIWWAMLIESNTEKDIAALARSTFVREIWEQNRGRGWQCGMHFNRIAERIKKIWLLRFSTHNAQCESVWAGLLEQAYEGWLPA